jgi:phospholipid N-methyltransferase
VIVYLLYGAEILIFLFMAQYVYYGWKLGAAATPGSSRAIAEIISLLPPKNGLRVVDLGSGWGGMTRAVAKARPDARVTGIELAPVPYAVSRLRGRLQNLEYLRRDLFGYPLKDADVVLCYMPPEMMARLPVKMRELPQGAVIISNSALLPGLAPDQSRDLPGIMGEKIFVYRVS